MSCVDKRSTKTTKMWLAGTKYVHSTSRLERPDNPDFSDFLETKRTSVVARYFEKLFSSHWVWDFIPGTIAVTVWMWLMWRSFGVSALAGLLVPLIPFGILILVVVLTSGAFALGNKRNDTKTR